MCIVLDFTKKNKVLCKRLAYVNQSKFPEKQENPGTRAHPGKYSADQILQHEEYHDASRRNPQLNRTVREALGNNLSDQELSDLVGRYITAYDGVYDFSGMTQAEIEALIEEELFADLYAGIDNTGRDALREDAQRGYAQAQTEQGQNTEAQRDTTGPPEGRAALNPSFEEEFDNWLTKGDEEYRLKDRGRFLVGITSDKLKEAGVDDYEIYFGKSKIAKIMKNPEMTPAVIKDAVRIVEEPIIVMDSKTVPGSIVMFGNAHTDNGKPVMVSMILHPETKTGEILDYGVISSTYGRRRNNAQSLIDSSNIRWVEKDKKRTEAWSKELGLQLPSSSTMIDSNDSIRQSSENSNPQNRASVEMPGTDPRRELRKAEQEYMDASNRSDPDYDYEGQYARIKELQRQAEAAPHQSPAATASPQGEANRDPHSERGEIGKRKKEYKAKCLERISPSQAFIFTHPACNRPR